MDRLYIESRKGSRHTDQQTGRQTATSASMKREHTAIDSYGQTGVDRLHCVQHYTHNKHKDHWRDPDILINKQVWTDYTVYITTCITSVKGSRYTDQQNGGQTATSASMKRERTVVKTHIDIWTNRWTDITKHGWRESEHINRLLWALMKGMWTYEDIWNLDLWRQVDIL